MMREKIKKKRKEKETEERKFIVYIEAKFFVMCCEITML